MSVGMRGSGGEIEKNMTRVTGSAVSVMNAVIFNAAFSSNTIASIY
jgi:hypothetical protein